jgi:hypothetical protein
LVKSDLTAARLSGSSIRASQLQFAKSDSKLLAPIIKRHNEESTIEKLPGLYARPKGGIYRKKLLITIDSTKENACIYYRLDGKTPNSKNGIYYQTATEILINKSVNLKAASYSHDGSAYKSDVLDEYYIIEKE